MMRSFLHEIIGLVGAFYIRFVWFTGKWTVEMSEKAKIILQEETACIPIFWHRYLMMMPMANIHKKKIYMLVSKNKIGDMIEKITQYFNIFFIRGSARNYRKKDKDKGGDKAMRQILSLLKEDKIIAFAPDGPKGPAEVMKKGPLFAAFYSQKPLIPVTCECSLKKILKSWDRFILPLPFSKGVIRIKDPIYITEDNLETARPFIEEQLS